MIQQVRGQGERTLLRPDCRLRDQDKLPQMGDALH